ncbi:MAG TPA: hypothetical protein VLX44_12085 [Xanthobacteraceae bacterium]|nr:hypothetical protein [Xanthobacteraceae bacterium]
MTRTFAQIGGARIGFFNATWPFARLSADRDAIALRLLLIIKFTFPRDRIRRLSRYSRFFSTGLQIEHAVGYLPKFMLFWTFDFGTLKAQLESLGYEVRDSATG